MHWFDWIGCLGAATTFTAYCLRTMVPLRAVSICSNLLLMTYGYCTHTWPQLILHAILLPLNASRLVQMLKLVREVKAAAHGGLSLEPLLPFMDRRWHGRGEVLFRRGDPADKIYYVLRGAVSVPEARLKIGPGDLAGVVGIFAPGQGRPWTAVCETDVELLAISESKVIQLCHQQPRFGIALAQLVTRRLVAQGGEGRPDPLLKQAG